MEKMNYVAPAITIVQINSECLMGGSPLGTENNAGIGVGGFGNKPSHLPSRDWTTDWD